MINEKKLKLKLAEELNSGHFLDEFSSWIGEVQIKEDYIIFRVDDDDSPSSWYKIELNRCLPR